MNVVRGLKNWTLTARPFPYVYNCFDYMILLEFLMSYVCEEEPATSPNIQYVGSEVCVSNHAIS